MNYSEWRNLSSSEQISWLNKREVKEVQKFINELINEMKARAEILRGAPPGW